VNARVESLGITPQLLLEVRIPRDPGRHYAVMADSIPP
jgi:hypothetical protein